LSRRRENRRRDAAQGCFGEPILAGVVDDGIAGAGAAAGDGIGAIAAGPAR